MSLIILSIIIFFVSSLIEVVLNTLKSLLNIKGSVRAGAIMTAVAYGVYPFIIKLISDYSLWVSIPITIITNFIGVYVARFLFEKGQKPKLWRVSCTFPEHKHEIRERVKNSLQNYNIEYLTHKYDSGIIIDIFSKTRTHSQIIKSIIDEYDIKYSIYVVNETL